MPGGSECQHEAAHRPGERKIIPELHRIRKGSVGVDQADREIRLKVKPVRGLVAEQVSRIGALTREAKIERAIRTDIDAAAGICPVALIERRSARAVPVDQSGKLLQRVMVGDVSIEYRHVAGVVSRPVTIEAVGTGEVVKNPGE